MKWTVDTDGLFYDVYSYPTSYMIVPLGETGLIHLYEYEGLLAIL